MGLSEILQNSIPEMIGAGIGAFLRYLFGVQQERRMNKEEDDKKREDIQLPILTELKEHKNNVFSQDEILTYTEEGFTHHVLFTSCFDSAISSGTFNLLKPELQNKLSYHYNKCKMSNDKVIRILDTPRRDIATIRVERLREFIDSMRDPLTELIGLMEKEL